MKLETGHILVKTDSVMNYPEFFSSLCSPDCTLTQHTAQSGLFFMSDNHKSELIYR